MRLDVLSEMPQIWAAQVMRWRRVNRTRKKQISDGRVVPDSNEEYLLYQTLIGTWPIQMENGFPTANLDSVSRAHYIHRIQEYMTKAVHEAKVNLSWINPDSEYVDALCRFIDRILTPGTDLRPNTFLRLLETLVPRVAYYGSLNSLSQTLMKLTAPGVPDIYQGQELLDFSLVDPDNRRPVDFQSRQQILDELDAAEHGGNYFSQLMRQWPEGRLKLWVTSRVLRFRAANREIFERGSYVPLFATGEYQRHLVGFARIYREKVAIVAATRFLLTLTNGDPTTPVLGETWDDSELGLPADLHHRTLKDVLSGQTVEVTPKDTLHCQEVFRHLPLALLVSE
jgi:(1->4)-alpha-D-glucan 1-alpha-D-glucosylmutase